MKINTFSSKGNEKLKVTVKYNNATCSYIPRCEICICNYVMDLLEEVAENWVTAVRTENLCKELLTPTPDMRS